MCLACTLVAFIEDHCSNSIPQIQNDISLSGKNNLKFYLKSNSRFISGFVDGHEVWDGA